MKSATVQGETGFCAAFQRLKQDFSRWPIYKSFARVPNGTACTTAGIHPCVREPNTWHFTANKVVKMPLNKARAFAPFSIIVNELPTA